MRALYFLFTFFINFHHTCFATEVVIPESIFDIPVSSDLSRHFLQDLKNENYAFIREQTQHKPPLEFIYEYTPYFTIMNLMKPERYEQAISVANHFGWITKKYKLEGFEAIDQSIDHDNVKLIAHMCDLLSTCPADVSLGQFISKFTPYHDQKGMRRQILDPISYQLIRDLRDQHFPTPVVLSSADYPGILTKEMKHRETETSDEASVDAEIFAYNQTKKDLTASHETERNKNLMLLATGSVPLRDIRGLSFLYDTFSSTSSSDSDSDEEIITNCPPHESKKVTFFDTVAVRNGDDSDTTCALRVKEDYSLHYRNPNGPQSTRGPANTEINIAWGTRYSKIPRSKWL